MEQSQNKSSPMDKRMRSEDQLERSLLFFMLHCFREVASEQANMDGDMLVDETIARFKKAVDSATIAFRDDQSNNRSTIDP